AGIPADLPVEDQIAGEHEGLDILFQQQLEFKLVRRAGPRRLRVFRIETDIEPVFSLRRQLKDVLPCGRIIKQVAMRLLFRFAEYRGGPPRIDAVGEFVDMALLVTRDGGGVERTMAAGLEFEDSLLD